MAQFWVEPSNSTCKNTREDFRNMLIINNILITAKPFKVLPMTRTERRTYIW